MIDVRSDKQKNRDDKIINILLEFALLMQVYGTTVTGVSQKVSHKYNMTPTTYVKRITRAGERLNTLKPYYPEKVEQIMNALPDLIHGRLKNNNQKDNVYRG